MSTIWMKSNVYWEDYLLGLTNDYLCERLLDEFYSRLGHADGFYGSEPQRELEFQSAYGLRIFLGGSFVSFLISCRLTDFPGCLESMFPIGA